MEAACVALGDNFSLPVESESGNPVRRSILRSNPFVLLACFPKLEDRVLFPDRAPAALLDKKRTFGVRLLRVFTATLIGLTRSMLNRRSL